MTLRDDQNQFLSDVAKLIQYTQSHGFTMSGGELFRTEDQQAICVKKGLSKTYKSKHLTRLAIDFNFFKDGKIIDDPKTLEPIGRYWESLSDVNVWGGRWKSPEDPYHFQRGK